MWISEGVFPHDQIDQEVEPAPVERDKDEGHIVPASKNADKLSAVDLTQAKTSVAPSEEISQAIVEDDFSFIAHEPSVDNAPVMSIPEDVSVEEVMGTGEALWDEIV